MPEEATAPPTEAPDGAAPSPTGDGQPTEAAEDSPSPNAWIRETALGLTYSRPLDTSDRSKQWSEANAELRRGRRIGPQGQNGTEETRREEPKEQAAQAREPTDAEPEPKRAEESAEERFRREVQAEVDRREAVRTRRAEADRERELRRSNPEEYAKYKEQQEQQNGQAAALSGALVGLAKQFDDNTVTPLLQALVDDETRTRVVKDSGHGMDGRKTIVGRAVEALKKASYDEGYAKGKAEAEKSLRRPSSSFRKELLAELRGEEDEPELAPGNGRSNGTGDLTMNDWMRAALGKRSR